MLRRKKRNIEFVDSKVEREELKGFSLKGMIDGSLIAGASFAKHLPFILFLVLLAVIYIANRYHAENKIRQIESLKEEVKNLRVEQITTAKELMNLSIPSEVQELVDKKELGLKSADEPPIKIVVKE